MHKNMNVENYATGILPHGGPGGGDTLGVAKGSSCSKGIGEMIHVHNRRISERATIHRLPMKGMRGGELSLPSIVSMNRLKARSF